MINLKIKNKNLKFSAGMTYVELIVVLSIFSIMSAIVLFNHDKFQGKVDVKNLASDIGLKIIEAQKSSLNGKFPPILQQAIIEDINTWKPSYGTYFNINPITENKSFIYFVDLDRNNIIDSTNCIAVSQECLERIDITKGSYISNLDVFYKNDATPYPVNDFTFSFVRPNSEAVIKSSTVFTGEVSYAQLTIKSVQGASAIIKVYRSGRIEIK
jgi:type II secretory pathway pseudopilin PulG